jgi:coenzyme F420-reducing hydrogenase gamma subunit
MTTMLESRSKTRPRLPRLAVFKFASCDGCQLSILDVEPVLLDLAAAVDIVNFPEASSDVAPGPYDLGLVEGSITTPHDIERIHEIRRQCGILVAIGACATTGGVQALRNAVDVAGFAEQVYPHPEYLDVLQESTPIGDHVTVDLEIPGCPVDGPGLVAALVAVLAGRRPDIPTHSVCLECKMRGTPCVIVSRDMPCLGPVTRAGCGALCPSYGRGCFGCFGPADVTNVESLAARFDAAQRDVLRRGLTAFTVGAPAFRKEVADV